MSENSCKISSFVETDQTTCSPCRLWSSPFISGTSHYALLCISLTQSELFGNMLAGLDGGASLRLQVEKPGPCGRTGCLAKSPREGGKDLAMPHEPQGSLFCWHTSAISPYDFLQLSQVVRLVQGFLNVKKRKKYQKHFLKNNPQEARQPSEKQNQKSAPK